MSKSSPRKRKPKAVKPPVPKEGDNGRPTKYYECKDEVMKFIAGGNSIKDSCVLAGISTATFHLWKAEFSEFSDDLKKALAQCKAARIARILAASKKSWTAAAWWLERMYPDEFALKRILDVHEDRGEDPADVLIRKLMEQSVIESGGKIEEEEAPESDIPRFL
jgi:hypothetical protein